MPSQSSEDSNGSQKFKRTLQGKQERGPVDTVIPTVAKQEIPPPIFQMPHPKTSTSSFNFSFEKSINPNPIWSSLETTTQPNTAATSFTSDASGSWKPPRPWQTMSRTTSTTIGSLDENEAVRVSQKFEETVHGLDELSQQACSTDYESLNTGDYMDVDLPTSSLPTVSQITPRGSQRGSQRETLLEASSQTLPESVSQSRRRPNPKVRLPSREPPPREDSVQSPTKVPEEVLPSKTGVSYKIRNIPEENLFVPEIPLGLGHFPYFLLFICLRVSIEHKIDLGSLLSYLHPNVASMNTDGFWEALNNYPAITEHIGARERKSLWSAVDQRFDGYVFKGKVRFESRSEKSVFGLDLLPVVTEKSCRFERVFGSDRFLYLTFPTFESSKAMGYNKQEQSHIQQYWLQWFNTEHSFLGRKWRAFHAEPSKKKGSKKDDNSEGIRVILFATEGIGISQKLSVGEMVNWFISFANNQHEAICKAFARLDLGLSRTVPTLVFRPSQVRYISDTIADGTPEDVRYNDPTFLWPKIETKEVMNDGCAQMSFGAAKMIWDIYKLKTGVVAPMPSIFQARVGGAKGVWMVSPQTEHTSTGDTPIWIELTNSQLKFKPHDDDYCNDSYDPHRLTFDVVSHSNMPKASDLHNSFISIMVDRGVPLAAIEKVIRGSLDLERQEILDTLLTASKTYFWVDENTTVTSGLDGMLWQAGLPTRLDDKIKFLLEPGFQPMKEPYLGQILARSVKQKHQWDEQKLRVPMAKAAYLYGVADPMGVLEPGEIHVKFSEGFDIETTGERFRCLEGINALVGRQPALRHSDLQKVRTVSHPDLAHLEDVVVFASKGEYPLAGKLQGGDYDGDTFWVCWEPELVEPFKNAPAPVIPPDPAKYGIKVLKTKLLEVMNPIDLSTVPSFLQQAAAFRIGASLLGQATNYHEKQAYKENRVFSPKLDALCDIHDLLVDAPKQGYSFNLNDWQYALRKVIKIEKDPGNPAYKRAMDECSKPKQMGEGHKIRNNDFGCKDNNTIDYLYFRVVRKHNNETQRLVGKLLCKHTNDDEDLRWLYHRERAKENEMINAELERLKTLLKDVEKLWNRLTPREAAHKAADQYNAAIERCYKIYCDIEPEDTRHPLIQPWLDELSPGSFTKWERLRASCLYVMYPEKRPTFVYHMAGDVLACMKSEAVPFRQRHLVVDNIFSGMKPSRKRMQRVTGLDGAEDDDAVPPMDESA